MATSWYRVARIQCLLRRQKDRTLKSLYHMQNGQRPFYIHALLTLTESKTYSAQPSAILFSNSKCLTSSRKNEITTKSPYVLKTTPTFHNYATNEVDLTLCAYTIGSRFTSGDLVSRSNANIPRARP